MNTITTWDELIAKQAKETADYLNEYKKNFEQFQADQKTLRNTMSVGDGDLPKDVKEVFDRNEGAFKNEWGLVYGRRAKALGFQHQKEIDGLLTRRMEITKLQEQHANSKELEKTH
jgi:hypothetical protein